MATMRREELSEVVAGLILSGRLAVNSVRAEDLVEPYSQLPKLYKRRGLPSAEEIISVIGPMPYQSAIDAANTVKSLPANWPILLEQAAVRHDTGTIMEKDARRLIMGEDVDLSRVHAAMARMDRNQRILTPLHSIEPDKNPFSLIGYEPLDKYLGGLPQAGLTVIGGPPGTGKTWLLTRLAKGFAKRKKKAAIFSLEMTAGQFAARAIALALTKTEQMYVELCDDVSDVSEISTIVSRAGDIDFIGVDFAELLLAGDSMQTEQAMATVYRTLAWTAKRLGIPVVLLSQLNRQHNGQIPTLTMLRYTGMGEALAALVLFLHNPAQIYIAQSDQLPIEDGLAYIVVAKSRFGYGDQGGPGAIQIPWDGATGWGDRSVQWFPLT